MKNKYLFIISVNIIPYLILLAHFMSEYLGLFNAGTAFGYIHMIIFLLIFIFNVYHIPKIIILKMPMPLLLESRVIGIAVSIALNTILFFSIWYTAVQIDSVMSGY